MSEKRFLNNKFDSQSIIDVQSLVLDYILGRGWKDLRYFARNLSISLLENKPRTKEDIKNLVLSYPHAFYVFNEISKKEFLASFPLELVLQAIKRVKTKAPLTATQRRRAKEPITNQTRLLILGRDSYQCRICGAKAPEVKLHVDHIKPVARRGKTTLNNLWTLCEKCNLGKSDLNVDLPK